ncbi:FecR domain-containing protein [Massilibacteroides sp.]|uniref:FecR family protein n=1 Tax=Massilibacteroides sp. TaxID=2034766 RepID=UPI002626C3DE|nr:FecR domain-containing protein [Massilibacteroides sp.]MDD4515822.1 DUF4974 domain-containing protein [Massilibacteroides sp.]
MEDQYSKILKKCLEDEVNIQEEWTRLSSTIKEEKVSRKQTKKKKQLVFSFMKYVAAILLGVIISSAAIFLINDKPEYETMNNYKLHTDKGEKSYIELPDGSKIWLNTCTTIEYSPDYGKSNRDIYLDGEAYFEVARNKEIPFVVKTNGINVKALGTTFNVSAYSDDPKLITTLYSGQVSVQPTLTKQEILLDPNQMAVYYKDRHRIEKMSSVEKKPLQWRDGILSFEMMQMEEIVRLLERNYDIIFQYENQRIKKLHFSGTFSSNESINDILKVITTNTSIGYVINKDTVVFR